MACLRSSVALLSTLLLIVEVYTQEYPVSTTGNGKHTANVISDGFAVDLMYYDHVDRPYAKQNLTLKEKAEVAINNTLARQKYFQFRIYYTKSEVEDKAIFRSPLHSVQNEYVMKIRFGTPSRTFLLIVDTGSSVTWLQCATCQKCYPQPDRVFEPSASSTYRNLPCKGNRLCDDAASMSGTNACSSQNTCLYEVVYGDRSVTAGDLASETITLITTSGASVRIPNVAFGCGHFQEGLFHNTDGLAGFGQDAVSLVSQIGSRIGNVFSYCLSSFYKSSTKTSTLLLGSPGPVHLGYTPMISNPFAPTFYYVSLLGITVNCLPVQYPPTALIIKSDGDGGVIVDSGTTLTSLVSEVYTPFKRLVQSTISYPRVDLSKSGFELCYKTTGIANPIFPKVTFSFDGVYVTLPANNVFINFKIGSDFVACLAIVRSSVDLSIYGNFQQQNFQVAFDRAKKVIGFAPNAC